MSASSLQAQVQHASERFGDHIAQVFVPSGDPSGEAQETSFAEFAEDVRRRAGGLAELGIARDDRVSMMTPLGPHGLSTLMGAMVAATAAPINYFLEASALARLVEATGAVALVVARSFADEPGAPAKAAAVRAALPHLKIITYGKGPEIDGALDLDAAAERAAGKGWIEQHCQSAPDRVVALFHTGGTTGRPKLVPHTEAMYEAMIASSAEPMGVTAGNRILGGLPLFHTSGALQAGIVPVLSGCGVIIPSPAGFRAPGIVANYWAFVRRFDVTVGGSVPTVLNALAGMPAPAQPSKLKHILCGGAPLPLSTIEAIAERGDAAVLEGWGMTETCGFSVLNPQEDRRVGSAGVPFSGVEMQVREAKAGGEVLPPDTIGELVVRGDIVISNYLEDRTDSFTNDGWLRTGDLARVDRDGYLHIVGRAKDLIIRGGHNIDPALIENPAYAHPAVELAAAVGRPDRYAGELPILFVQLRSGMTATPDELLEFIAGRIEERAAMPKAVHIIEAMPISGPGKVSKVPLRSEAARAVMQAEVDALDDGAGVVVTIVDDDRHGVAVRLQGPVAPCLAAAEALVGYPYHIVGDHMK